MVAIASIDSRPLLSLFNLPIYRRSFDNSQEMLCNEKKQDLLTRTHPRRAKLLSAFFAPHPNAARTHTQ